MEQEVNTSAILKSTGVVINTIIWNGGEAYTAPPECTAVQIDTVTPMPGIGWTLAAGTWTAPVPPAPVPDI
jgi:hypothetical protein